MEHVKISTTARKLPAHGRASTGLLAFRRQELERWIDQAIALLNDLDGDPDLEPEADEFNGDEGNEDWRRQP